MTERLRVHRKKHADLPSTLARSTRTRASFSRARAAPLQAQSLRRRGLKAILERSKLSKTIRWYDSRHTFATPLLAAGENVKVVAERLGRGKTTRMLDLCAHVLSGMREGPRSG